MSGCTLRFTRNSPLRTILVDEATGDAKYQIDTPSGIARIATRIRKLTPSTRPPLNWDDPESDTGDDDADNEKDSGSKSQRGENNEEEVYEVVETKLPETSDEIARIYWKWFSSDRIIFRGKITTKSELLSKCGKMKGSYMFTGPDGAQYRWAMGAFGTNYPKLVTADEKKQVVAEFHRAHYITKRQKPRLEVQPAGMDMLDYIILTFVIVENKRRERESTTYGGSGGY